MVMQQLSIFLKNEPGVLAKTCAALAVQKINIRAMSVSDTVDHAVVRLVVDDPHKAMHLLGERGVLVVETDVLAVEMDDRAGSLAEIALKLAHANVNIEYAYGSSDSDKALVILRVSNIKKAQEALGGKA